MHRLSTSFVLGYHGCASEVADDVIAGAPFSSSQNDYDWLGPGIYFWQSNPLRALQFAEEKRRRDAAEWRPTVVGAVIDLGLCLDLATAAGVDHVKNAHRSLTGAEVALPTNAGGKDLLLRRLDCAVIRALHQIRVRAGQPSIDTVFGIFLEGEPIYPDAGFFEKTHIQICVCNPAMIHGVFRVPETDLA